MVKTLLAGKIIGNPLGIACPEIGGDIFTITILGVSCGVLALILHIINKRLHNKKIILIKLILLTIFILYSFGVSPENCSNASEAFDIELLPYDLVPFF